MPSREQVRELLDQGLDHAAAGRRLGIPAGLAHMIATGVPADGSDTITAGERLAKGVLPASQRLANPPAENPTTSEVVRRWIRRRVSSDAQLRQVSALRSSEPPPVEIAEDDDVPQALAREHNRLQATGKRLKTIPTLKAGGTSSHVRERWAIASWIARELPRHEQGERESLWPRVREHLADGPARADDAEQRARADGSAADELLGSTPGGERFEELVADLVARLRHHVATVDKACLDLRENAPAEALRRGSGAR